jgi:carbon storage regulator CsrA
MLMFTRRLGEKIVIGGCVEVRVAEIHKSTVRLAIDAPHFQSVVRGEVYEAVAKANRVAADAEIDEHALLGSAQPAAAQPATATPGANGDER